MGARRERELEAGDTEVDVALEDEEEGRTQPFSEEIISSGADVVACLELAGGAAERLGLKPGDRVEHALFKPKGK